MIRRFWVRGFRNLSEQVVDIGCRLTVISGENNQGKTNFLESIFYAGTGTAISGEKVDDLIQLGSDTARTALEVELSGKTFRLYRDLGDKKADRRAILDGKFVSKLQVFHLIRPVYWSADLIRGFQDSADNRRGVMDQLVVALDPKAITILKNYNRVLLQRNMALKSRVVELVDLYSEPLIKLSSQIVELRIRALRCLVDMVARYFDSIGVSGLSDLNFIYMPKYISLESYSHSMTVALNAARDKEFSVGYTTVGAHRDDFDFFSRDTSILRFFSRGICRTVALLIQLAILDLSAVKSPVILLIDDAFCEISSRLKLELGNLIFDRYQSIYVTVDPSDGLGFLIDNYYTMKLGNLVNEAN